MREFGSLAVLLLVFFAFMPFILAQKLFRRAAFFGLFFAAFLLTGGFRVPPVCFL